MRIVRMGIIGDFDAKHRTHVAMSTALQHTAEALPCNIDARWLPTPGIGEKGPDLLRDFDAL